ncbi:MAG: TIGR01777 family oxidoreductase [Deltaproteobacteria bacterium]|nr:TIGR01777 family oxidoreductase [Deltaproteobacteria bacterium]
MKIFMTGGTGFVGSFLSKELAQNGHDITILTRREKPPEPAHPSISYLTGDPTKEGGWMARVPEHDWVINLAGASVFGYWTEKKKKEIYDSRILTTRNLVRAITQGDRHTVLCSTSAPGYYGSRGEETLTEDSLPGDDFLGRVAKDWEDEAFKAQKEGIRVVITRFGIVLGKGGGVLAQLVPLFKAYMGGPAGDGSQWFSWIHRLDQVRGYMFLFDHPEISGPVNLCAPNPVRNWDLAKALGRVLGRPSFLRAPAFMLRLAMGEMAEVILTGQKMIPKKLLDAGFQFQFPTIDEALADLLRESGG